MKRKLMLLALSMVLSVSVLAGCSSKPTASAAKTNDTASKKTDTVSGASQAVDEAAFEQKIGKDGNWMVIVSKDLTFTKDLTVDGTFTKKGTDGKETITHSIGLATETADQKVDKRFTITVPRLVINSENTKIEYGTIKGDVYVQAKGFTIKDGKIDGNLYFATEDLKNAFKLDATTKVTGETAVKAYTK